MAGSNPFATRSLVTSLRFHIVAADDDDEGESGIEKRRRALSAVGGDAVRRIIPDWMAYWDLNGALIGDIRGTERRLDAERQIVNSGLGLRGRTGMLIRILGTKMYLAVLKFDSVRRKMSEASLSVRYE